MPQARISRSDHRSLKQSHRCRIALSPLFSTRSVPDILVTTVAVAFYFLCVLGTRGCVWLDVPPPPPVEPDPPSSLGFHTVHNLAESQDERPLTHTLSVRATPQVSLFIFSFLLFSFLSVSFCFLLRPNRLGYGQPRSIEFSVAVLRIALLLIRVRLRSSSPFAALVSELVCDAMASF